VKRPRQNRSSTGTLDFYCVERGEVLAKDWSNYQEEAAEFFRSLGLDARTNAKVEGARGSHDVDVLVVSNFVGFELKWIVECKYWKTRVSKLHVLGLRTIVQETGADRGIVLAETGFQSGAIELAKMTNVHLTSLAALRTETSSEVFGMQLTELYDRVEACRIMYGSISKRTRIEYGLRPDTFETGYSGRTVITTLQEALRKGFRGSYPFSTERLYWDTEHAAPRLLNSPKDLVQYIEPILKDLETRLSQFKEVIATLVE